MQKQFISLIVTNAKRLPYLFVIFGFATSRNMSMVLDGDSAAADVAAAIASADSSRKPTVERYLAGQPEQQQQQRRHRDKPMTCGEEDDDDEDRERKNSNDSGYCGNGGGGGGAKQTILRKEEASVAAKDKAGLDSPIRTGRMMTPIVR